ncbi:hypothetical protein JCM14076_28520 [Methylosoma difficile]
MQEFPNPPLQQAEHAGQTDSVNQAFNHGICYGLEYVLDELATEEPDPEIFANVDWFGASDYFA